ncbi:hypothetical protein FOZ63_007802, partial [Perkinsus olseni]
SNRSTLCRSDILYVTRSDIRNDLLFTWDLAAQVVHKDKNKYATKSPVMAADSFNFCLSSCIICRVAVHLEGKHNSEDIYLGAYMHFTEKQGVSDEFPLGTPMKLEIELVNHDNLQKSIVLVGVCDPLALN